MGSIRGAVVLASTVILNDILRQAPVVYSSSSLIFLEIQRYQLRGLHLAVHPISLQLCSGHQPAKIKLASKLTNKIIKRG